LFSNQSHLLAVVLVGSKESGLGSHRGAQAPACSSLTEGGPYRLRVGQAVGAHDFERGRGGVIETYMQ
jgi:hypothetical protein